MTEQEKQEIVSEVEKQILEKMKHAVEVEAREYFSYDRIAMSISEDYYLQKSVLE